MTKIKIISLDDNQAMIQVGNQELAAMLPLAPYFLAEGSDYEGELTF